MIFYCINIPHFLYPLSLNGHLDCFYFLAIMNTVAVNIVYKFLCRDMFLILLGINLGMELLGHTIT